MRPVRCLVLFLYLSIKSTTGYVILSPQGTYTVFENNASAVFNCSGDGYVVSWYLNGSGYSAVHVQRGIQVVPATPTGGVVSSSLYIPSNSTNNNTEVLCKVADVTFTYIQTSGAIHLTIQGPLDAPYNFSVAMSNTSFNLSWDAPFSLNVTKDIEIFNYTLCTNITIYGCKTIPSDPDCTFPRTCTSSVDFTDPSLNGTNKTIMDYSGPILFTFAAINGAGIGNTTEYIFNGINDKASRIQVSPSPTETVIISTISYTNSFTSDHSIGLILGGLISGAAVGVIVVLSLVIAILIAIKCCFMKKKSHFKPSSEYNDYCTQSTRVELTDPGYFLPLSDFRPATCTSQGADKSCIEFGILPQSNKEQYKVESGYADVVCVPIISIPAPKQEVAYSEVVAHNTVTPSHPPSGRKSRNPCPHRIESDGDDEDTCSYPSTKRSQHQRRIECDGDEEDPPNAPVAQPSEHTSSNPPSTCRCDNVVSPAESNKHEPSKTTLHTNEGEEEIKYLVKDDTPKVSSSASHDSSQSQQCTECGEDGENDWCQNSISEKEASVPQQFTPGVLVETGYDDSKQRNINSEIKYENNTSYPLPFIYEADITDNTSTNDEGRPHNFSPADMPIQSSIVPSVTVKESLGKSSDETGCVHGHEILNVDCCQDTCSANDGCATNHEIGQAQVTNISDEKVCQKTNKDTLQEELQHILLQSKVFPSMECSSKDISTISEYSFDWRLVGRHLLNDNKIKDIDNECGNEGEKRKKMLLEWKRTKSFDATYRALAKVLSDVGYNIAADDVEKLEISQAQSINFLTAEDIKPDFHKICSTSSPSYYPKESISIEYIEDDNSDFYWCQEATTEKKANITQQFSSGLLVAKGTSQSEKTSSEMIDEHINDRIQNTKKELSSLNNNAAASSENEERTVEQWDLSKTSICTCTFRIMVQRDLRKITIRMQTKFGAAGVGKTHLQHFLMNNPPEQCFSTGLADNPIKAIYSSLEDDWFLYKELIEKAILPSRYQEIMIAIKGKDHPSKAWKTFLQAVKAIGEGVIFWLLLDVAYGQALYAKNKQCI